MTWPDTSPDNGTVTVEGAARLLGVSPATVHLLLARGQLHALREHHRGEVLFRHDEVVALARGRE